MEWQQLEYFQTLAKVKNFTKAAEELAITQSALSRSIAKLEEELGAPLFDRKVRGVMETGVKLLDIELARITDSIDPKRYVPSMEVAAELGGRHVLSSIWTNDRTCYLERFAELCDLAKPFGLTVELEFVPIASVCNLSGALDVLRTVQRENAGLMLDIHHFHRSGDRLEDLDAVPQEWFRFLHLCDAPGEIPTVKEEMTRILREARLYVGEGGIDVASIVSRVPEIPYSIELPNLKRVQELGYEEFARRCLQTARDYLDNHPRGHHMAKQTPLLVGA